MEGGLGCLKASAKNQARNFSLELSSLYGAEMLVYSGRLVLCFFFSKAWLTVFIKSLLEKGLVT